MIWYGDCRELMAKLAPNSIDAIVTDPPYELGFMGKSWDSTGVAFDPATWAAALRVLKPGGHMLAFGGTRTMHRIVCAIEDAGFEIRDSLMWIYGSGFPKSLDVSKAIDKAAGAERTEIVGSKLGRPGMAKDGRNQSFDGSLNTYGSGGILATDITAPATDAARKWQGWGTALKPAFEPIVLARKPLEGTVAANVLKHGVGGINVDGCRVDGPGGKMFESPRAGFWTTDSEQKAKLVDNPQGRWPANVIHDGSAEVLHAFPTAAGQQGATGKRKKGNVYGEQNRGAEGVEPRDDSGSAARFFYSPKASKKDRGEGNTHPTVKPSELMQYLVRLITPPGGLVVDPFGGSGTTGVACIREGFRYLLMESDPSSCAIANNRLVAELAERR